MHYDKKKRNEIDRCNICGKRTKLSWDHVPPKCCNNNSKIKVNTFFEGPPNDGAKDYIKNFQNGVKYRSICNECNNSLLGGNYDKELERFTQTIDRNLTTNIILPRDINIKINVNMLCRAICGHLLAAKNFFDNSINENILREYVLNDSLYPPENFKLLYWIYPYSAIFIMRDFWIESDVNHPRPDGMISLMYSFPIGCNGVQREHNKKLNNGLPILHKVPPKRDYGRYFCILAEKGGTSHGGLTEKLSPFFHAKKQEVNAYGR